MKTKICAFILEGGDVYIRFKKSGEENGSK